MNKIYILFEIDYETRTVLATSTDKAKINKMKDALIQFDVVSEHDVEIEECELDNFTSEIKEQIIKKVDKILELINKQ